MRARTSSLRSPRAPSRYRDTSSRESTALVISSSINSPDYTIRSCSQPTADRTGELRRAGGAAEIARADLVVAQHEAERPRDAVGDRVLAEVAQHQQRREQERRGVRHAFAGDVGRAAMDGFEDADVRAQVGPGYYAEPAHEAGAQVRHDVAVQVRQEQHVEL